MKKRTRDPNLWLPTALLLGLAASVTTVWGQSDEPAKIAPADEFHWEPEERLDDPYLPVLPGDRVTSPARRWSRGAFVSVQVNVDVDGNNIVGDAANEPSIAVDPTNPQRMAIGWRQFDTIVSNFRQAGVAFTTDGGANWTFPGVIEPGVFRSDPVLDAASDGTFYYHSLESDLTCDLFESGDGGVSWGPEVFAFGGDKNWMAVDRTGGRGDGHIYGMWSPVAGCCNPDMFNRSTDGGDSFETPIAIDGNPRRGVTAVGPEGEVYVSGHLAVSTSQFMIAKSTTAQDDGAVLAIDFTTAVDMGGSIERSVGPNPAGLLGQVWVAAGASTGAEKGPAPVYVLASINPPGDDPLDVHIVRSFDGGVTFEPPVRVNDDPQGSNAWQWFGTLSVAATGRLDAVWADTRGDPGGFDSVLYYAFSEDGGSTWSANVPVSPAFDPHLGWPQQNKIGDYYDMKSDAAGVNLAYAATFNGEQDVYYLRIDTQRVAAAAIFSDGFESGDPSAWD